MYRKGSSFFFFRSGCATFLSEVWGFPIGTLPERNVLEGGCVCVYFKEGRTAQNVTCFEEQEKDVRVGLSLLSFTGVVVGEFKPNAFETYRLTQVNEQKFMGAQWTFVPFGEKGASKGRDMKKKVREGENGKCVF